MMALKQQPPSARPERRPKRGIWLATFVNGNKYREKPLERDEKKGNRNGEAQMESSFGFNAVTEARKADIDTALSLPHSPSLSLYLSLLLSHSVESVVSVDVAAAVAHCFCCGCWCANSVSNFTSRMLKNNKNQSE